MCLCRECKISTTHLHHNVARARFGEVRAKLHTLAPPPPRSQVEVTLNLWLRKVIMNYMDWKDNIVV